MIEFAKEESYEVRVVNGDEYDYEVAGKLAKDEDGVWHFNYGDQSIAYEDSLEETTDQLKEVFENGKNNDNVVIGDSLFHVYCQVHWHKKYNHDVKLY